MLPIITLLFPAASLAAPLATREIQSIGSIDPSTDEWSSTLSGIGPLILLVGERTTQQVLRKVHSPSSAFSLAAAPLGLLSVVTSLIRFCGTQQLRAFIGYELEARTVSGIEVTRVNCGGVTAHLTHGYVVRSINANPASQLIAVSILKGGDRGLEENVLQSLKAIETFERQKRRMNIPNGEANVNWCMHITLPDISDEAVLHLLQTLTRAVGVDPSSKEVIRFQRSLMLELGSGEDTNDDNPQISSVVFRTDTIEADSDPTISRKLQSTLTTSTLKSDYDKVSIAQVTSVISEKCPSTTPFWNLSFMTTFDAVSEFTTSSPSKNLPHSVIGIVSFSGITIVHILALWQNDWVMSIGWILVVIGYLGIVFGILFASLLISSSCISIRLDTSHQSLSSSWNNGMAVAVKNVDSMDTTGTTFVSCPHPHQNLEAVYIKPSTRQDRNLASFITISLIMAFIAHYLGLRAIKWWASIGELGICILAAFARSVSNDAQPRFTEIEDLKIDKRCASTGLITTQKAHLLDEHSESTYKVDGRSYALKLINNTPTVGERVAYQIAKLSLNDEKTCASLTKLTGLKLAVSPSSSSSSSVPIRSIIVSFTGGILVSEGLASPAPHLIISFQAHLPDLAAPTSLLGRTIMRQPEWRIQKDLMKGIPLGNVYLFAMQSMLDWWTVSEDRNDMVDLQKNLHWPMLLVNCAFFLGCLQLEKDEEVVRGLEEVHGTGDEGELKVARDVVEFLRKWEERT